MAKSNNELLANQPKKLTQKERVGYKLMEIVPDGGKYTSAERIEALNVYVSCGSLRKTASLTGIPRETLKHWTETRWFEQAIELVLEQKHKKLEARWLGVQERSLDLLDKSLEVGEEVLTKDGTKERIEVGALTAAKVAALAQDKRVGLIRDRKGIDTVDQALQGVDKLVALANAFAKIANATKDSDGSRVIDITNSTELIEEDNGEESGRSISGFGERSSSEESQGEESETYDGDYEEVRDS